eukprot:TRINITY_DN4428_c0_g1_i1.p2 TRINITY_DN4428_c0_g1~~TRINITY_DN4428_c0_g1_i1.p2  ORF type:complete len:915 (-),score=187.27 TRINITY_DN4428_c0_g1_i1:3716-6460(-)
MSHSQPIPTTKDRTKRSSGEKDVEGHTFARSFDPESPQLGPSPTPETEQKGFLDDFIVISEFSEQVGPVPLLVIPDGAQGTFDLNAFVLRAMAVDYQNKSTDVLGAVEDTQVVMSESKEDAFAYVHHVTLMDINARGYVRPVCLSYITHDSNKIMHHFQAFLTEFSRISNMMKHGNQASFLLDVEQRVADLSLTREVFSVHSDYKKRLTREASRTSPPMSIPNSEEQQTDYGPISPSPDTIHRHLEDLVVLHSKVKCSRTDRYGRPMVSTDENNDNDNDNDIEKDEVHELAGIAIRRDTGLEETEDDVEGERECFTEMSFEMVIEQARANVGRPTTNPALSALLNRLAMLEYEPSVVYSLRRRDFDKELRGLEDICGLEWPRTTRALKEVHAHLSRPNIVLTCERDEERLISPLSSLMAIGNTVVTNFGWFEGGERLTREGKPGLIGFLNDVKGSPLGTQRPSPPPLRNMPFRGRMGAVASSRRLSLTDVSLPPQSTLDGGGGGFGLIRTPSHTSTLYDSTSSYESPYESAGSGTSSDVDNEEELASEGAAGTAPLSFDSLSLMTDEINHRFGKKGAVEMAAVTASSSSSSVASSSKSSARNPAPVYFDCFASSLWEHATLVPSATSDPSSLRRGRGITKFRSRFGGAFLRHITYSIMKGRPVVVLGVPAHESIVRDTVQALSVFVTGYGKVASVVPWKETPLKMSDLAAIRVVGLVKSQPKAIPKCVEQYVTILDVEGEMLRAPRYPDAGGIVDDILALRRQFPDEATLLAHIHCKLLEIGIRVGLYYHLCCVQPSYQPRQESNKRGSMSGFRQMNEGSLGSVTLPFSPVSPAVREQAKANFFRQVGYHRADAGIIEYLAEVVKEQQVKELQVNFAEESSPIIRLDFTSCVVFKNKRSGFISGLRRRSVNPAT